MRGKALSPLAFDPFDRLIWKARGFTLVEVLAAMAVLVIVVMFLGRAFNDASSAFRRGSVTVERNGAVQVAMEKIARDLEGMVVNTNFACFLRANAFRPDLVGCDEFWFVTTTSDQTDDSAYHFVRYSVTNVMRTNVVAYQAFELRRTAWKLSLLRARQGNSLNNLRVDWWEAAKAAGEDPDVLLDNVVRFDIYYTLQDGSLGLMAGDTFRSDRDGNSMPPACVDVYIQATTDEAMRQAGAIVARRGETHWGSALSLMYRDSNVLIARITPVVAPGQRIHPAESPQYP